MNIEREDNQPIHLLIDTSSWKQLIDKGQVSNDLLQIQNWVKNDNIKILCPEILVQEWVKHREVEIKSITRSLTQHRKAIALLAEDKTLAKEMLNIGKGENELRQQIYIVDDILTNYSIKVPLPSEQLKAKIFDLSIEQKPPFHNKRDSANDALLIFTALDYIFNNNLHSLSFISANHTEFGDPANITKKIHPEILKDYKSISIDYHSDVRSAINDLRSILPHLPKEIKTTSKPEKDNVVIDKTKPILDQLHDYFKTIFNGVNFIPPEKLVRNYPFRVSDFIPHYRNFSFTTNNEELFTFFESIKISIEGSIEIIPVDILTKSENAPQKVEYIFKKLRENLISRIQLYKTDRNISIWTKEINETSTVKNSFFRFDFVDVFKRLDAQVSSSDELLELAYIQYQVGDFIKAYYTYKKVLTVSENKTTIFIVYFNLTILLSFIQYSYSKRDDYNAIIDDLKSIDLEKQLKKCSINNCHAEVLKWINDFSFLNEAKKEIPDIVKSITESYYHQLFGGWQSNSHSLELLNKIGSIEYFLNENFIIYDKFGDYLSLFDSFAEGMIASHAMKETIPGRFTNFDDFIIHTLIVYGNSDTIRKFFNRYRLKHFVYKESGNVGDRFSDYIRNVFSNYVDIINAYSLRNEDQNRYFSNFFEKVMSNIITIMSLINLDPIEINSIAKQFFHYFEKSEKVVHSVNEAFIFFFNKRGKEIESNTLNSFLFSVIENKKNHAQHELITTICTCYKDKINLSEERFKIVLDDIPLQTSVFFSEIIIEKQRDEIKNSVIAKLNDCFDDTAYYYAGIIGLIYPDGDLYEKFIRFSDSVKHAHDWRSFEKESGSINYRINALINLAYKYDLDLTSEKYDVFRGISLYYDWLLNIDGFDYKNFIPSWIAEYRTRFYHDRFAKQPMIAKTVLEYLHNNQDDNVEKSLLHIHYAELLSKTGKSIEKEVDL